MDELNKILASEGSKVTLGMSGTLQGVMSN
jgi:hypothetical protein